jgi:hypothetical protein
MAAALAGGTLIVGIGAAVVGSSAPARADGATQTVKVTAPADAAANPSAVLRGVSCTSAGNCAGVGTYTDSSLHIQAMQASETSGVWSQAAKVTAPSDAATDPSAALSGVSCTSAGNCAGVGAYTDTSGNFHAMQASETSGVWGQAAKVTAPADAATAPGASLPGVSCASAGNCGGVGTYHDSSGNQQAMQASETSGVWGQAAKVTAPAGADTNPGAFLTGVSCPSAGNCVAVGTYVDSSGHNQAMAASESSPPTSTTPVVSSNQFGIPNQTDVFEVATNGAVEVRWVQGGGTWQGPLAISAPGVAPPGSHLAVSQQFGIPNQTDVWVVANNGAVDVFWVQGAPGAPWHGPLQIGPSGFAPAGAALTSSQQFGIPNQTDVWVVANNGAVDVFWVQGAGVWNGPLQIGPSSFAPAGAALTSSQQFGIPNQTDVWEVANNGAVHVFWVQGAGVWNGPLQIGPTFAPAGAALTSSQQFGIPNQTDVWEVANSGDGPILVVFWVQGAGTWNGPLGIGPPGFAPAGAPLTSSQQFGIPNQTDVWEISNNGAVHVFWVDVSGAWKGPLQIGPTGFAPAGAPLTSSQQFGVPNQTDVWEVANSGDTDVFWVQGASAWNGPLQI